MLLTVLTKKQTIIFFGLLILSFSTAMAQTPLQKYIDSAIANNIVLRREQITLEQAEYALKSSRRMFLPKVDLQADYASANGGRDIVLPLGDLLNGVYSTLNQLTSSHSFPQLQNEKVNFLPTNFYDAKIHTTVPIVNTQLVYNKRIHQQKVVLSRYQVSIYKRDLVEKVKLAYYNFLQSLQVIKVYQSSLALAQQGKRMNENLLKNGKGLPAYVLRSQSEVEKVKAKLIDARQNKDNAQRYFNFLLNRNQEATIDTMSTSNGVVASVLKSLSKTPDVSGRAELGALSEMVALQKNVLKLDRAVFYPTLNGFVDVGSQAENWQFDGQSRYVMFGLQLSVPLFAGNRHRLKMKQTELDITSAKLHLSHVKNQLAMSGAVYKNKLKAAYHEFLAAEKQLDAAQSYQRLIQRGYKAGVNTYIETIDARNQLTEARIAVSVGQFKMLAAKARLERATASDIISD